MNAASNDQNDEDFTIAESKDGVLTADDSYNLSVHTSDENDEADSGKINKIKVGIDKKDEVVSITSINEDKIEIERLQLLVSDLSRRLQNAQHTIESYKKSTRNATTTSEIFRSQLSIMSNVLRLETVKNITNNRNKMKNEETIRYENDKKKASIAHNDLRMCMIDHAITGMKQTPKKIIKMKKNLENLENQQDSQKLLLQHLVELDKMTEQLSSVAQIGDLVTCNSLLKRGVNVNEIDSAGYLPIHYACSNGHTDIVKLLLEFGADATSYLTGHAPIEIAAKHGHHNVIKILVDFGGNVDEEGLSGVPPIVSAASGNYIKCVEELIRLGSDINAYDFEGNTALHVATRLSEPVAMIRLLIKSGINHKAVNRIGHTPLKMAFTLTNVKSIEALGGRSGLLDDDDDNEDGDNDDGGGINGDIYDNDSDYDITSKLRTNDVQSIASTVTMNSKYTR